MFCLRALCFLKEIERRFFDAESTDADASGATTTQYLDRDPDSRSTWKNVANLALPTRCVAPTLVISFEPNLFLSWGYCGRSEAQSKAEKGSDPFSD